MAWNEADSALVERLWADGKPASKIAEELGGRYSRNAVLGRLHRLGLVGAKGDKAPVRKVVERPSRAKPERLPKAPKAERHAPPPKSILKRTDPVPEPEPEPIIPPGQRVTILMLTEQTCRWPMGTPGTETFTFCGRRPGAGTPYCMAHARLAYQPPERRRAA